MKNFRANVVLTPATVVLCLIVLRAYRVRAGRQIRARSASA